MVLCLLPHRIVLLPQTFSQNIELNGRHGKICKISCVHRVRTKLKSTEQTHPCSITATRRFENFLEWKVEEAAVQIGIIIRGGRYKKCCKLCMYPTFKKPWVWSVWERWQERRWQIQNQDLKLPRMSFQKSCGCPNQIKPIRIFAESSFCDTLAKNVARLQTSRHFCQKRREKSQSASQCALTDYSQSLSGHKFFVCSMVLSLPLSTMVLW